MFRLGTNAEVHWDMQFSSISSSQSHFSCIYWKWINENNNLLSFESCEMNSYQFLYSFELIEWFLSIENITTIHL